MTNETEAQLRDRLLAAYRAAKAADDGRRVALKDLRHT